MSLAKLYYHIIFRPKNSKRVITEEYQEKLYMFIWSLCKKKNCYLHRINGMTDHIHMLVEIPVTLSVADFVRDIKVGANVFMKNNRKMFPYFEGWGRSYCVLSYSKSEIEIVKEYIKNQKTHHAKHSYAEELRKLYIENGVEFKEEYLLKD